MVRRLLPFLAAAVTCISPAKAKECDCYLIDGSYPTYYKSHVFFDFRSMAPFAVSSPPPIPTTPKGNYDADFTSSYFSWEGEFTTFWGPQRWSNGNAEFENQNSYNNLYVEHAKTNDTHGNCTTKPYNGTYLTMCTARLPKFQTSAEFESLNSFEHASMRMHARTIGSPGACTAMFTYSNKDDKVEESDIEILTYDPTTSIHYTNQPSYFVNDDGVVDTIPEATRNITLSRPWTKWATHRIDWTPGRTTWSLNGKETRSTTFQAPINPARIMFNAWSDGKDWTGKMPLGGQAFQHIQWIEIVHGVVDEDQCETVCAVDEGELGVPEVL